MFWAIAILCGLILWPAPGQATLITTEIEAVVDGVSDERNYLEGKIKVGDIITGFYTYDSSVTRLPGERYEFDSPPCGVFLSVGGFGFETDSRSVDFEMGIGNDLSWGDTYFFISFNNLPLSNGVAVDTIRWQLDDPSGTALDSTALPEGPLILDDWQENILTFGADRLYGISAHITYAIPEPVTIMLVGIGAVFLRKRS
jgi:hypothetical protein